MVRRSASSSTVKPVSTNSESQRNETFIRSDPQVRHLVSLLAVSPSGRLRRMSELAEEAKIVAGKRAHIVDAGAHHRQTLDTESEGKAAVDVRVVANRTQDVGMDHAGATHLQPAGPLADPA